MRTFLLSFSIFCCSSLLQAQTFAPDGSVWQYCKTSLSTDFTRMEARLAADTIADGKTMKQVRIGYPTGSGAFQETETQLYYVNGDTTYVYDNNGYHLLHNFGMAIGDTIRFDRSNADFACSCDTHTVFITMQVVDTGTTLVLGQPLRYYDMESIAVADDFGGPPDPTFASFRVIEKVGLVGFMGILRPQFVSISNDVNMHYLTQYDASSYSFSDFSHISCSYLGNAEESTLQARVYPNPVADHVNIQLASPEAETEVLLRDAYGRTVYAGRYNNSQQIQLALDQAPGIYFITLRTAQQSYTTTLVKK